MAMTADDMLKLRDKFVTLYDYRQDKKDIGERFDAVESRVKCAEESQAKNDLVVMRIDTQLKIIMWICSVSGAALIGILVKQLCG